MVGKYSGFLLLVTVPATSLSAKHLVDCRVITGGTTECNPYSTRLLRAKEVSYDINKQKLIVTKTLPVPAKKPKMRVVSVADMIEKYVHVDEPMRYRGSNDIVVRTSHKGIGREEKKAEAEKPEIEETVAVKPPALPGSSENKIGLEEEPFSRFEQVCIAEEEVKKEQAAQKENRGYYRIVKGDTLSTIAAKYGMKTKELIRLNQIEKDMRIRIGSKLLLPFPQETVDAIATGEYRVREGDTLLSIAQKFDLKPREVAEFNHLESTALIREGKTIQLPFPYRVKALEARKKAKERERKLAQALKKKKGSKLIRGFGKHKLRVTATAYSSHCGQTDKTPFLAAWNNRIRPGMKIIAVSRDLLTKYGLRNGSRVRIGGLPGIYRVRDKMNKRYKKRIDIYMGTNRRKALRWGRRSVILYW